MEEKIENKYRIVFIIAYAIGIIGVILASIGTFYVYEKEKKEEKYEEKYAYLEELLIPYDRNVISFEEKKYNYMFADKKVDYDNISSHLKFLMIFNELKKEGYDNVKYLRLKDDIKDLDKAEQSSKYWDEIDASDYCGPECDNETKYYYQINKELIHKYAKIMFNSDDLIDDTYLINYGEVCTYNQEDDDYFCHLVAGGGTGIFEYITKLDHIEEKDNEVILYHKAYFISSNKNGYLISSYYTSNKNKSFDEISLDYDEDIYKEYGTMYKSIFRKTDNKYYWFSSEPVK